MVPGGDWLFWLLLAGRGFGKTRVGAETVREWAENPGELILMVAPTASDVREVMIDGPSGLMSCYPHKDRPDYNPSRHLVRFKSGSIGITRSADEPERLRGPQFTKFWWDELCACRYVEEAWDQIMFGFRVRSPNLRGVITTTPKPIKQLRKIISDPDTYITRGSSYENRSNLSEKYYSKVIAPYEGTRLGRQEVYAEILEDVPGALWNRDMIERSRIQKKDMRWDLIVRVVVGVDPAVSTSDDSDETGIVVVALVRSGHLIVFDDKTCRESPLEWARIVVEAYREWKCSRVVAEVNNGGNMVETVLRTISANLPYRAVRAADNKYARAEPVAALYEQGRVHHMGSFPELEDQMCGYVPRGVRKSPDRMDALVWAITELCGLDQEKVTGTVVRDLEQISAI